MGLNAANLSELERLRRTGGIVAASPGVHLVLSFAAADRVLRDDDAFAAVQHEGRLSDDPRDRTLLESDPGRHAVHRRILAAPFTGDRLETLRPVVRSVVAELIHSMAPHGSGDLVSDLARPANGRVLARALGIPDEEREHVFALTWAVLVAENDSPPAIGDAVAAAPREEFAAWAHAHVARRRAEPDPPRDALAGFLEADPHTGVALTDQELVPHLRTFCESAVGFTGRALANLLHQVLVDDRARAAMVGGGPVAAVTVEESLRLDPPVTYAMRTCRHDTTVGGQGIARGDRVLVSIVAVNRDPAVVADPDRFVVRGHRPVHVSFGRGPHVCLGAALYRMLATEVVVTLLRDLPDVRLRDGFVYEDHPFFTGHAPQRLDVVFTPRPSR